MSIEPISVTLPILLAKLKSKHVDVTLIRTLGHLGEDRVSLLELRFEAIPVCECVIIEEPNGGYRLFMEPPGWTTDQDAEAIIERRPDHLAGLQASFTL